MITLCLGTFLFNNYQQALDILNTQLALDQAMNDLRVDDPSVFQEWLAEECEYLRGLSAEPVIETLEMEYYQQLSKLYTSE